jgi:putative (di)nucleoside polyphosphate hydrolase
MTPEAIARLPYRPCVGVVLANRAGEVFAGARIDTPGAWQMPQGGIDPGETPRDAAWRELWEETGVTRDLAVLEAETPNWVTYELPHDLVPRLWKGRFRGQKQKWVLFRFAGTDNDIAIDSDHPEFADWRWITPNALLDQIVPFKRHVYDQVFAAFGDRISG